MDDEYIEVFVEESKSLLTDLNNLLLELEEEPHNVDVMTSIFRNAHTLKGNSAAMGFDNLSETAHAIEDLLDALRQGKAHMDNQIMNLIFEGVDMIELLLGEIVESGKTTTQPGELINRIRSSLEHQGGEKTEGDRVKLKVKINPDSQMKGIDAMLIIKNIEEIAEMISTTPSINQIEDGNFDDWFEVVLGGSIEETQEMMGKLPQIKEYKLDVDELESRQGEKKEEEESRDADKKAEKQSQQEQSATAQSKGKIKSQDIQSIRISINNLDELMNMVEELVVRKLKLENSLPPEIKKSIRGEFSTFERILSRLQDTVMDLRLIPLKYVVDRLPRLVSILTLGFLFIAHSFSVKA